MIFIILIPYVLAERSVEPVKPQLIVYEWSGIGLMLWFEAMPNKHNTRLSSELESKEIQHHLTGHQWLNIPHCRTGS